MSWIVSEPYLHLDCELGEGPHYESERNELRFVDVGNTKLYFINLDQGPSSLRVVKFPESIAVTADIEGSLDRFVAGTKYGFALVDRITGQCEYICRIYETEGQEKARRMRLNDGAADSRGRFWAGSLTDPNEKDWPGFRKEGILFRLDPDGKLHEMLGPVTIPNGIGWNDRDDTMYWTESASGSIYAFDFDAPTGTISNRRLFFRTEGKGEVPDGFAQDEEGHIWTAIYGGSKVLRISPEGKVVGTISLPTKNITCPAFAGEDLFITTAADTASGDPISQKYGGSLFRVNVGVKGKAKYKFKMNIEQSKI